ncbi:hypothetical protein TNCV_2310381 [Trichonephila clavipes]|nr:hypothetical protein TNCV_2310381 [Trichonephila clavipes]
MRVWNQWVAESPTAGSSCPPITNAREGRHIVRSALQNRTTTSQIIREETGMFAARSIFARTVCSCVNCQHGDHYFGFP